MMFWQLHSMPKDVQDHGSDGFQELCKQEQVMALMQPNKDRHVHAVDSVIYNY